MPEIVIRTENLGKKYLLGGPARRYGSLRESLVDAARLPTKLAKRGFVPKGDVKPNRKPEFWALRGIDLEVERGEVLGIIGRNGAGKSTLLKILSRITEPTEGEARIRGRVSSLLEVGTGFNPELSGRDNVYLNGAILGMTRTEISRKFEEIVAFAEVEQFVDTQVKKFSTGMQLRLAFAVAAHLEPDILIVDEVLAVGDAAFQRKCLAKMEDVGSSGRTVIFVSHTMSTVTRLCGRVAVLSSGGLVGEGPTSDMVGLYLGSGLGSAAIREWPDLQSAPGNNVAKLRSVRVCDEEGTTRDTLSIRQSLGIEVAFDVLTGGKVILPNIQIYNEEGVCLFGSTDWSDSWRRSPRPSGRYAHTAWIPGDLLAEGTFTVNVGIFTMGTPIVFDAAEADAVAFHVVDTIDGSGARGDYGGRMKGVMRPLLHWSTGSENDF